jgi:hypothetical protein
VLGTGLVEAGRAAAPRARHMSSDEKCPALQTCCTCHPLVCLLRGPESHHGTAVDRDHEGPGQARGRLLLSPLEGSE